MSHIDDLVDAYTLGALEPEDVDLVERHIETCETCSALVESARKTAEELLFAVPQVAPPPELRGRLLARIQAEDREQTQPPERQPATVTATRPGLLSRFINLLFGTEPDNQDSQDTIGPLLRDLLAEPDCMIWDVSGTSDAPDASARLVATRSRYDAVLITNGLRPAGRGKAYQVWFLSGGKPVPNALFTVDRHGQGGSILRVPTPVPTFDTVAVTPEPLDGSSGPTGPIVLVGSIG